MFPVSVAADAPPMFAVLAANDPLFGAQGFGLVESWRAAKRPAEFHYYERGGHGFGAQRQGLTADRWMVAFEAWLAMRERLDGHC
jgi:acetyl esterase/lipase